MSFGQRLFYNNITQSYLARDFHKMKCKSFKGGPSLFRKSIIIIMSGILFFLLLSFPEKNTVTSVFRITEKPTAIIKGTSGSALTINLSFGDEPVKEWIENLEKPYPLLFVDLEWAERFPGTVDLIKKKKIPTGLLGMDGKHYEDDDILLKQQVSKYENIFEAKPLWFRTSDEYFPDTLHEDLWTEKINAIGSTFIWSGGKVPPKTDGEIIAVPFQQQNNINFADLKRLMEDRNFKTVEEVLFGPVGKTKKIPN